MRRLAVGLLLVTLLAPAPAQAAAAWEFEYLSPGTVAVPGFRMNIALCDDPDDTCLGGALFPTQDRNAIAASNDDIWGTNAAMLLCVWSSEGDETCHGDQTATSAGCGSRVLFATPFVPQRGVVYLYSFQVEPDLKVCGSSAGRLFVVTF